MEFTQGITIDGTYFDVPFVSIKRTGDFYDKYANRTEDGILHRELIGVYFNYTANFGTMDVQTHKNLWDKLSEPEEFHTVEIPDSFGTYSFVAYVSALSDEFRRIEEDTATFQNLTCKFIAQAPARR